MYRRVGGYVGARVDECMGRRLSAWVCLCVCRYH